MEDGVGLEPVGLVDFEVKDDGRHGTPLRPARDALWEDLREAPLSAGLKASWSTPIHASNGRILGTLAMYFRSARSPSTRDFDLMSRMTQLTSGLEP